MDPLRGELGGLGRVGTGMVVAEEVEGMVRMGMLVVVGMGKDKEDIQRQDLGMALHLRHSRDTDRLGRLYKDSNRGDRPFNRARD